MSMRQIDGAAALSEFQGYRGDCGETAELAALHVIDPTRWPLNNATLNAIVRRDIGKGWASASGAEPLSTVANDLALCGIASVNHGFSEPLSYSWRAILDAQGGRRPVALELANAAALPGDEQGLRYHFITCLAWDPSVGVGLFADGDNALARHGSLARYTADNLIAARVCGALEVTTPVKGWSQIGVPAGWSDDGATLTAPNGVVVVKGFRAWTLGHSWDPANVPIAPESHQTLVEIGNPSLGSGTVQWFRMSGQLTWTPTAGVFATWNGQEMEALRAALTHAEQPTPGVAHPGAAN